MKKLLLLAVMLLALSVAALCQTEQKSSTKIDTIANQTIYYDAQKVDKVTKARITELKNINNKFKREKFINDLKEQEKKRKEEERLRKELKARLKNGASDRNKRIIKT